MGSDGTIAGIAAGGGLWVFVTPFPTGATGGPEYGTAGPKNKVVLASGSSMSSDSAFHHDVYRFPAHVHTMTLSVESVILKPLVLISGEPEYLSKNPANLSCSGDGVEKLRATNSLPFTLKTQISNEGECPRNESAMMVSG
jgi:hypothetical protein